MSAPTLPTTRTAVRDDHTPEQRVRPLVRDRIHRGVSRRVKDETTGRVATVIDPVTRGNVDIVVDDLEAIAEKAGARLPHVRDSVERLLGASVLLGSSTTQLQIVLSELTRRRVRAVRQAADADVATRARKAGARRRTP